MTQLGIGHNQPGPMWVFRKYVRTELQQTEVAEIASSYSSHIYDIVFSEWKYSGQFELFQSFLLGSQSPPSFSLYILILLYPKTFSLFQRDQWTPSGLGDFGVTHGDVRETAPSYPKRKLRKRKFPKVGALLWRARVPKLFESYRKSFPTKGPNDRGRRCLGNSEEKLRLRTASTTNNAGYNMRWCSIVGNWRRL